MSLTLGELRSEKEPAPSKIQTSAFREALVRRRQSRQPVPSHELVARRHWADASSHEGGITFWCGARSSCSSYVSIVSSLTVRVCCSSEEKLGRWRRGTRLTRPVARSCGDRVHDSRLAWAVSSGSSYRASRAGFYRCGAVGRTTSVAPSSGFIPREGLFAMTAQQIKLVAVFGCPMTRMARKIALFAAAALAAPTRAPAVATADRRFRERFPRRFLGLLIGTGVIVLNGAAPAIADVSVTTPPVISGIPRVGQTLSSTDTVWSGGATTTGGWAWDRCTDSVSLDTCTLIPGLSWASHVYLVTSDDIGMVIRVTQYTIVSLPPPLYQTTVVSHSAPTAVITAASKPPDRSKPASTVLPTITGKAKAGKKLTVSRGKWTGAGPIGYKYQWKRCNRKLRDCRVIRGATKTTFTLSMKYVGQRLEAVVTATNSAGKTSVTSKPTVVVVR